MRHLAAASALVALLASGCALHRSGSSKKANDAAAKAMAAEKPTEEKPAPGVICRNERPTGTNIARRVCYEETDLEEASRAAQETIRQASRSGSSPKRTAERPPPSSSGR
jgi:hypothetical protein